MRSHPLLCFASVALLWLTACPIPIRAQASLAESGSGMESHSDALAFRTHEPPESESRPAYKSVGTAYAWSILGTAVPLLLASRITDHSADGSGQLAAGLILGGLLAGPSLGQFYAGSHGGGALGIGIRTAGSFMTLLGFAQILGSAFCREDEGDRCDDDGSGGGVLLIAGGITYIGGALYSLVDAGRAVDRYNESQGRLGLIEWSPILARDGQGGMRAGAVARMRF